jgi:hypothetical protein
VKSVKQLEKPLAPKIIGIAKSGLIVDDGEW